MSTTTTAQTQVHAQHVPVDVARMPASGSTNILLESDLAAVEQLCQPLICGGDS
ncbi:hypothetical protein SERLA73DRAFT_174876 [Serpula lacrymans var. lacrymans S7.3]|uniref:Uncharacterized protein n=2 Tax=Serpula lacrymans var. lacrymans TaxID=341189 RepID=F8PJ44_SERL3|nr:uncharacterized protein SERLADRAFT_456570 [Serpula lacrymans var. lacrymans S7.9]EGO03408.1 hypothetical protein SERLA73DRAFT_174876 [Serpula lacrymans var. lacrymans S7.3]EGO29176.1 hypothetical protein SERLADRAFT_456570 [Serpula lacrymans var. lacrymans S7.9]